MFNKKLLFFCLLPLLLVLQSCNDNPVNEELEDAPILLWEKISDSTLDNTLYDIYYRSYSVWETYIAVGENGTILISEKGDKWNAKSSGTMQDLRSSTYGNNLYIIVGDSGTILTSKNTETWTQQNCSTNVNLSSVVYNHGIFVAVGDSGTILVSTNGANWEQRNSGTEENLNCIAFGNRQYAIGSDVMSVIVSSDLIHWSPTIYYGDDYYPIYSMKYENGQFLAICKNSIFLSATDFLEDDLLSLHFIVKQLFSSAYGMDMYVFVGENGTIYHTYKMMSWTDNFYVTNSDLFSVVSANEQFVAVGENGLILRAKFSKY